MDLCFEGVGHINAKGLVFFGFLEGGWCCLAS